MKIVIFAAHPDDAETCCGGSIAKYVKAGHGVHVVNMTNKGTERVACADATAKRLGNTVEFLDFTDGEMRFDKADVPGIISKIKELHPDLVWTQYPVDVHTDHICTGALVLNALDQIRLEEGTYRPELWFFAPCEGYQALCFHPDHFEDVTDFYPLKLKAVGEYECVNIQLAWPLHQTMDVFHGYQAGCAYAEGFAKCNFRAGRARYDVIGGGTEVIPDPS